MFGSTGNTSKATTSFVNRSHAGSASPPPSRSSSKTVNSLLRKAAHTVAGLTLMMPVTVAFVNLVMVSSHHHALTIPPALGWTYVALAYLVCFFGCLSLGADSRYTASKDKFDRALNRATSRLGAMTAFFMTIGLSFGCMIAAPAPYEFAATFPLSIVMLGALVLGDTFGPVNEWGRLAQRFQNRT